MTKRSTKKGKRTRAKIDRILLRVDRLPLLDSRTADEILGYDERGMPESMETNRTVKSKVPDCPPDFKARAKKIFGSRVLPGGDFVIKERGRY
jgi:hypothetical protein